MKNSTSGSLLHDKLHLTVAQSYLKHEHDNPISWASKLLRWDANALVISHCKMHCLFNFHCSWHHSFALCKHVLTKRVEECEGWKRRGFERGRVRAGETQGWEGGVQREVGSVQESWRVVEYLHAQSLFTLHQAAVNRKRGMTSEKKRFERKWGPEGSTDRKTCKGMRGNRLNGDEEKFGKEESSQRVREKRAGWAEMDLKNES